MSITLHDSFDIRLQEGLYYLEAGNLNASLEIFRALEREGCCTPDLLEGMGRAFMMRGSTGEAIDYFRKAIRANPNLLTSKICLGITLLDHGEISEGVELLTTTLDNGKPSGDLTPKARVKLVREHVRLGEIYVELGQSMEAIKEFEKAVRIGGDYPDIRRKMAAEYMRMNLLEDAERELRRALHRNPFYEEARADLGFLYMLRGRTDLASEEWSQVDPEGRGSGFVSAYRRRGEEEVEKDQTDDQILVDRDYS